MKPSYIKYFKMVAVIWACCSLVFVAGFMFLLAPQRDSFKQIKQQFEQKKRIYEAAQRAANEETKAQLNKEMEALQSKLKDFVVDFKDAASVTFDISQIAREKRVSSFSIQGDNKRRVLEMPDCELITRDHVNIKFTGGFNQFAMFLNALERHRPVVFVDQFEIARSRMSESQRQVKMSLAFFVRKDRQDSDAIGTI
jgi:Tfp pilus assembly protein PilO